MKKEKKKSGLLGKIAAGVAVLAVILWLVLDAVGVKQVLADLGTFGKMEIQTNYSGLDIMMGISTTEGHLKITLTNSNFISVIAIVATILGALLMVLNKKMRMISVICFAVAGVIFLLTSVTLPMFYTDAYKKTVELAGDTYSLVLSIGSILSGILLLGSAGIAFVAKD